MRKASAPPDAGSGGAPDGSPLALPLEHIDEDPLQPRSAENPGFTALSLAELAASIRLRGVKTPISVRHHPEWPGRYIINHGARRYRASRLAQLATIPGFIDDDYSETDQVVENLQRNELTAREIANYIGRELSKGLKRGADRQQHQQVRCLCDAACGPAGLAGTHRPGVQRGQGARRDDRE